MKQIILLIAAVSISLITNPSAPNSVYAGGIEYQEITIYQYYDSTSGALISTSSAEDAYEATSSPIIIVEQRPVVTENEVFVEPTPVPARRSFFNPINIRLPEGFFTNISDLINGILRFVIIIAALLVFVYLIWGGIEWITSGGDKGKTESARNKITSAIIGLIILAASWALLTIVLNFLGYSSLDDVFNQNLREATSRQ